MPDPGVFDAGLAEAHVPGTMRLVADGPRPFILARVRDGSFHAVSPRCPHQAVDLSTGRLTGTCRPGAVGVHDFVDDAAHIRCPRHGYQFSVVTGESWFDPAVRLRTYPVQVRDGRVLVRL